MQSYFIYYQLHVLLYYPSLLPLKITSLIAHLLADMYNSMKSQWHMKSPAQRWAIGVLSAFIWMMVFWYTVSGNR